MGKVERLTAAFREGRAVVHEGRARAALAGNVGDEVERGKVERTRAGRRTAVPACEAAAASYKWHSARAEGQRRRFETLAHCGEGAVGVRCGGCGSSQGAVLGCDNRRLCVR